MNKQDKTLPEHLNQFTHINSFQDLFKTLTLLETPYQNFNNQDIGFIKHVCQNYYKNNFKNLLSHEIICVYEHPILEKQKFLLKYFVLDNLKNNLVISTELLQLFLKDSKNPFTAEQLSQYLPVLIKEKHFSQINILYKNKPDILLDFFKENSNEILIDKFFELFPQKVLSRCDLFPTAKICNFVERNPELVNDMFIKNKHIYNDISKDILNAISVSCFHYYLKQPTNKLFMQYLTLLGNNFYEKVKNKVDIKAILSQSININLATITAHNTNENSMDDPSIEYINQNFITHSATVNNLQNMLLSPSAIFFNGASYSTIIKDYLDLLNQTIVEHINLIDCNTDIFQFVLKNPEFNHAFESLYESLSSLNTHQHKIFSFILSSSFCKKGIYDIEDPHYSWIKLSFQNIPSSHTSIYFNTIEHLLENKENIEYINQSTLSHMKFLLLEFQLGTSEKHTKKQKI